MWVYWPSEPPLYTVGYYVNSSRVPREDFPSQQAAADRVHFLNGGERTTREIAGGPGLELSDAELNGQLKG